MKLFSLLFVIFFSGLTAFANTMQHEMRFAFPQAQKHVKATWVHMPAADKMASLNIFVTDAKTNQPVDLSDLTIEPFMPHESMNHGSSPVEIQQRTGITGETITGTYLASRINFMNMGGVWELRFTSDGETVVLVVDIQGGHHHGPHQ